MTTAGALFRGAHGRVLTLYDRTMDYDSARPYSFGLDHAMLRRGLETLARQAHDAGRTIAERGAAAAAAAGLVVEPATVAAGISQWPEFLVAADEIDADAIVCGARGRGAVARSLLGSTSTSLLHHSTRPVLVVPRVPRALDGPALIAYDGSPGAREAISRAGRLMGGRAALVVHVWRSPIRHALSGQALAHAPVSELREFVDDYDGIFAAAAERRLEEGKARARDAGFETSGEWIESAAGAWRTLADTAEQRGAAVIVAGSRGRGGIASATLGSVSSGLVHNADTPTLVVHRATTGTG